MTQEVQPLAWQKRTNLEEHQQFFSKINEIIANLAPTVNEAEAAIAQATQAIATANAASASADAASQQAQTAADTVAGYDTRLTAVENADTQNVKLTGDQTITGMKTVPTTATGVRDTQIANGTRIQNDLAAYEPMVRTTGQQSIAGIKEFLARIDLRVGFDSESASSEGAGIMRIMDRKNPGIKEGEVALTRNIANGEETSRQYMQTIYHGNDYARLSLELLPTGTARLVLYKTINGIASAHTVVTL